MTRQTHSVHFWSSVIACNVSAKGFVFNQSITGGYLENDKMTEIAYSSDQLCPNDVNLHFISVGGYLSEIQDGRRQPYWICSDIKKSPNLHRNDRTISF